MSPCQAWLYTKYTLNGGQYILGAAPNLIYSHPVWWMDGNGIGSIFHVYLRLNKLYPIPLFKYDDADDNILYPHTNNTCAYTYDALSYVSHTSGCASAQGKQCSTGSTMTVQKEQGRPANLHSKHKIPLWKLSTFCYGGSEAESLIWTIAVLEFELGKKVCKMKFRWHVLKIDVSANNNEATANMITWLNWIRKRVGWS